MTLYTSANKSNGNLRKAFNYLVVSAFTGIFSAVYEHFSFGVFSSSMIFAFVPTLLFGALPLFILSLRKDPPAISSTGKKLYRSGIAFLTVGMIYNGVIEIYGTDSPLTVVYYIASALLLITGGAVIASGIENRDADKKRGTV